MPMFIFPYIDPKIICTCSITAIKSRGFMHFSFNFREHNRDRALGNQNGKKREI